MKKPDWFDWLDLLIPVGPAIACIVAMFIVWHPILLLVTLTLLGFEAVLITWRLEK